MIFVFLICLNSLSPLPLQPLIPEVTGVLAYPDSDRWTGTKVLRRLTFPPYSHSLSSFAPPSKGYSIAYKFYVSEFYFFSSAINSNLSQNFLVCCSSVFAPLSQPTLEDNFVCVKERK